MLSKEIVEKFKMEYKKIGYIECPAFGNEKVYFNHYGLQHIQFKGRTPRSTEQTINRFNLTFKYYKILKNIKRVESEEKSIEANSTVYFWTIKSRVGFINIRIILRRLNNGTLHFFSIMTE
jgi:hypothetical protein